MRTHRTSTITTQVGLLAALAWVTLAGSVQSQESLTLREMGVFYAGGEVRDTAGFEQHVDQALVHYLVPDVDQPKTPVVMYPGLGLSSYIYLSTPDGREGWAQTFARQGFSVYVYDPVNTGPSGFAVGPFRSADQPAPGVASWNIGQVWRRWGFGDAPGEPYADARFPTDYIGQFYASWPPRIGAGRPTPSRARQSQYPGAGSAPGTHRTGRTHAPLGRRPDHIQYGTEAPRTGHGHRGPGTDRMPDSHRRRRTDRPHPPSLPSTATTSSRVTRPAGSKPAAPRRL